MRLSTPEFSAFTKKKHGWKLLKKKRRSLIMLPVPQFEALALPNPVERATQETHADVFI